MWYGGLGGTMLSMESTEVFVTKRASKSTRVTAAKRGGRTIRRTATRSTKSRATPKKTGRNKATQKAIQKATPKAPRATSVTPDKVIPEAVADNATPAAKPNQDPVAEGTQTTLRKTWKARQRDAEALAKTQHGAIVDQRAHVRATTGHRWTARKTH
jgi:hypothetical protein